jgi:outer membrane protein
MSRALACAKKLLPLTLLLSAAGFATARAEAQDLDPAKTNVRLRWVKSSETRLGTAIIGDYDPSPESNYAISADWGQRFSDTLFTLPIEMTANLGLQYFAERGYQSDAWGATAYIKAHYTWRLPFTELHIRFGLGEGLSYVTQIPMSEQRDFAKKGVESANLMNYVEWTIDVPLRQVEIFAPMFNGHIKEAYIGYIVWHRSSVFGLFADKKGGVNFMGFGFEARY